MTQQQLITGPTFAEMLDPSKIRKELREKALSVKAKDPLDPINLYNISWKDGSGRIYHEVLPRELTGVDTPIVSTRVRASMWPSAATVSMIWNRMLKSARA